MYIRRRYVRTYVCVCVYIYILGWALVQQSKVTPLQPGGHGQAANNLSVSRSKVAYIYGCPL